MSILYYLFFGELIMLLAYAERRCKRNIVLIVADDLGWNDVSLHGSDQIPTPNIDMLGYSGVTLGRYYTHTSCTPSRAALLTGKYAHTTGMQGWPLTAGEDRSLPVTEKILPQYFKELGYATHLVGKWHIGSSRKEFLPTRRGFDTFFGHRGGFIDYYEYTLEETWNTGKFSGFGLYRNDTAAWDVEGYITDVYNQEALSIIKEHDATTPLFLMLAHNAPHGANEGAVLQAPPHDVRAMRHVESPERRIFAGMMKKLDESVGDVVEALDKKGILNNTVIVFISDNGAMTSGHHLNYGSNWPLRGNKMAPFEGGVRVTGALWVPFELKNHLYTEYVHVTDWLPTLLEAVGATPPNGLDGINLWNNIIKNISSHRKEFIEIDDYTDFSYIVSEDYKLLIRQPSKSLSNHQGNDLMGIIGNAPNYIDKIKNSKTYNTLKRIGLSTNMEDLTVRNRVKVVCKQDENIKKCYPEKEKVCLFNIKEDPCELQDLSETHSDLLKKLITRLYEEKRRLIPRLKPFFRDPRARPALFNYTWSTFADYIQI